MKHKNNRNITTALLIAIVVIGTAATGPKVLPSILEGTVHDGDGDPLENVTAVDLDDPEAEGLSDETGKFGLYYELEEGVVSRRSFYLSKPGYGGLLTSWNAIGGSTVTIHTPYVLTMPL